MLRIGAPEEDRTSISKDVVILDRKISEVEGELWEAGARSSKGGLSQVSRSTMLTRVRQVFVCVDSFDDFVMILSIYCVVRVSL